MEEKLFCTGGGCTAKLGAGALHKVLSLLPKKEDDNLLVGFDSSDDAAVYKVTENIGFVQTLDFFPPMLEDPYVFGKIAATNALSDVYAMGGEVKTALNIVCFPEDMDLNILGKILMGGNEKVIEAGGVLAGGHSIADSGVKYGLSVTGLVNTNKIWKNEGARQGDVLILTKPLGVGIICTANRIGEASKEAYDKAVESMTTLNKYAAEALKEYDVHACTDVTGFGLLVHLKEMLNEKYSAVIDASGVPYFKECRGYIDEFYLTAAAQKNRNFCADTVDFGNSSFNVQELLLDPQTSGGLLVSVSEADAYKVLESMKNAGVKYAAIIGRVIEKDKYSVYVKGELNDGI